MKETSGLPPHARRPETPIADIILQLLRNSGNNLGMMFSLAKVLLFMNAYVCQIHPNIAKDRFFLANYIWPNENQVLPGGRHKKRFEGNWNFLVGCKEGDFR